MRARSSAPLSSIGGRRAGARACVRSCFFILLPTVLVGVHFRPCCFLLGRRRCRRRRNCYYYYVPSSFFTASPAEAVAAAAAFVRSFARRSVGRSGELATFSFFLLQRRFSSTWPNKRASERADEGGGEGRGEQLLTAAGRCPAAAAALATAAAAFSRSDVLSCLSWKRRSAAAPPLPSPSPPPTPF